MLSAMDTLNLGEDVPLEYGMLTKGIESAQKKKEGINFASRKNVLEYDDVMNKQRELIYAQRNKVLDGEDLRETVMKMIDDTIDKNIGMFISDTAADEWDFDGLREFFGGWICSTNDFRYTVDELNNITPEDIKERLKDKARMKYAMREKLFTAEIMREAERVILLRNVDNNWMDHIDAMDQLKQGIGLRAYGQHDPVVAYRNESYDMFEAMTDSIREQTAKQCLSVIINSEDDVKRERVAKESSAGDKPTTVRGTGVVALNAPCPCGSGKKYKRCCGKSLT